jgi:hypothetical protein
MGTRRIPVPTSTAAAAAGATAQDETVLLDVVRPGTPGVAELLAQGTVEHVLVGLVHGIPLSGGIW